jgi:hypothetical protein
MLQFYGFAPQQLLHHRIRPKAAAIAPRVIIKSLSRKYKTSKVAQSVTGITIKIVALALTDFKIK